MTRVCYKYTRENALQNQWEFIMANFSPDSSFVVEQPIGKKTYDQTIALDSFSSLPTGTTLVVMAHPDSKGVQGSQSLVDYVHPENATYIFGNDEELLTTEDLEGLTYDTVYVPTGEMYSHVAAAITLYDRMVKSMSYS